MTTKPTYAYGARIELQAHDYVGLEVWAKAGMRFPIIHIYSENDEGQTFAEMQLNIGEAKDLAGMLNKALAAVEKDQAERVAA